MSEVRECPSHGFFTPVHGTTAVICPACRSEGRLGLLAERTPAPDFRDLGRRLAEALNENMNLLAGDRKGPYVLSREDGQKIGAFTEALMIESVWERAEKALAEHERADKEAKP